MDGNRAEVIILCGKTSLSIQNNLMMFWHVVLNVSEMVYSNDLAAPADLIMKLEKKLRLPRPNADWDF